MRRLPIPHQAVAQDSLLHAIPHHAATGTTPGPCKRKRNEVLEYIQDYTERQEQRQRELDQKEEERESRKEKQLDKLIGIFGKLAENSK